MWANDVNKLIDESLSEYDRFEGDEDWDDIQKWIKSEKELEAENDLL